jgi:3-oxoacyl-ACP reductase-like protein
MLRVLTRTKRKDKVKIKDMLESTKMLSVNQTAAQIKLTEMWKVEKVEQYPIKMELVAGCEEGRATRSGQELKYKETGRTKAGKQSFRGDAPKLWNKAPRSIKTAKTLYKAKREIKRYCKTLPI